MSVLDSLTLDDNGCCFVFSEKSSKGDDAGKKKKKPKKDKSQTLPKEESPDPFKMVCSRLCIVVKYKVHVYNVFMPPSQLHLVHSCDLLIFLRQLLQETRNHSCCGSFLTRLVGCPP